MRTYETDVNRLESVFLHLPAVLKTTSHLALEEMGVDLFRSLFFLGSDYNIKVVKDQRLPYLCDLFMAVPGPCSRLLVSNDYNPITLLQVPC